MRIALALSLAALTLGGCNQTIREINRPPELSAVGSGIAHDATTAYQYPERPSRPVERFSLWDDRQSRMFTDPRALQVGDILTVLIYINDKAKFENESARSRTSSRDLGLSGSFDLDGTGAEGSASGEIGSKSIASGTGQTERSEAIRLQVAAVVTGVMPNGNLIIRGTQEVRVNAELRILEIGGIVRPRDISPRNTISYERIAEARISYGGRGRLTEVQQPPYGQQILDLVLPF
ncbi:MAG: flagellar basal body L-ring protein FlgH [Rhizobiaceae bacterium]|nr:flagellar basal body L-ring protein FlgH [Rhizobiaceae bacterium]MCV0407017.1 flagellar basal body L-ring protein FlgH [Rhizobiaceae bacterium]